MTVYFLLGIVLILLILLLFFSAKMFKGSQDILLHQKIDSLREELTRRTLETQNTLFDTQKNLTDYLTQLYKEIGNINQESLQILNLTKSFHEILRPTKKRGLVGESILENILKDTLPQGMVISQHTFSNGRRVDFLIKLSEGNLPIDAKFSLDTFKNYLEAPEHQKEHMRRAVLDGIKKRIDESSQYILPEEGTLEFAFMYIPSEAVYYFLITETDLIDYAKKKRVFVVGPNNFYVYLQTLLFGMKALRIEEKAKIIYNSLKGLELEVENLLKEYAVLGGHLRSASNKYEEVRKKIESTHLKLSSMDKL